MRIVNLMEDTQGTQGCLFEHGLSFYMETCRHRLLLDFGASDKTWANAQALGIDLSKVDIGILSHGHYDHSGGILSLLERNPQAKIYMQRAAAQEHYKVMDGREQSIGIDPGINGLPKIQLVDGQYRIDDELELFAGISGRRCFARGNRLMKCLENGQFVTDDFRHEQCAVIRDGGVTVLFSGCAHNGILNILDHYHQLYGGYPDLVISGFHMIQNNGYSQEDIENIKTVARELTTLKTVFYTGHCTGPFALELLKEIMGDQLQELHCGMEIVFP